MVPLDLKFHIKIRFHHIIVYKKTITIKFYIKNDFKDLKT